MFRKARLYAALWFLLPGSIASGQAPGPETAAPSAEQLMAAGFAALGAPAAVERAQAFEAEHTGWYFAQEQGRDPREPWARVERRLRWAVQPEKQRLRREAEQLFPGGVRFLNAAALTPGGGWNIDLLKWRTGVDVQTFAPAEATSSRVQCERTFPHLMLRQAKAAAETLAPAGAKNGSFSAGLDAVIWAAVTTQTDTPSPRRV